MKKSIFITSIAMFILALAICVTSCKENPEPEVPQKKMLPTEIIYSNNHEGVAQKYVAKFTYDNKNRVVSLYRSYSGYEGPDYYVVGDYVYNSSGQLTDIAWKAEGGYESTQFQCYTYSDNFVTLMYKFPFDSAFRITGKYELQNDRIIKEYSYKNGDFQEIKTFSYDALENISKITNHNENYYELISYDNKKGVFSGVNSPKWRWYKYEMMGVHQINNSLKSEFIFDDTNRNYTTTYEYLEYNDNDYPTKIKVNGLAEIEIKYIEAK